MFLNFLSFSLYGYQEFTHSGFERNRKKFLEPEIEYGHGRGGGGQGTILPKDKKTILVTGMNSGIGKQTVLSLIQLHAHSLSAAVVDEILKSRGDDDGPELVLGIVDMSRPSEIINFVKGMPQDEVLDVLINNAGALIVERQETPDAIESSFAMNTLGTYTITEHLLPFLKRSKDARVITVSSGGMYNVPFSIDDLESKKGKFDGTTAYAQQKRAQVELTNYWAKAYPSIKFFSMHPGWTKTPGLDRSLPSFSSMMNSSLRDVQEGCDTILFAALSKCVCDPVLFPSGSFLFDRAVVPQHLYFSSTNLGPIKTEAVLNGLLSSLQGYMKSLK